MNYKKKDTLKETAGTRERLKRGHDRAVSVPSFLKPILWSYDVSRLNPYRHERTLIVQAINYGDWAHWRWIGHFYGKRRVKEMLQKIPASEFRPSARVLAYLLFKVSRVKYVSRSTYLQGSKALAVD